MKVRVLGSGFLMACLAVAGCGGVAIAEGDTPPALKLLELYPRHGEQGVDPAVEILAVFSDDVFSADCQQSNLAGDSFTLARCTQGQSPELVTATVGCYRRQDENRNPIGEPQTSIAVLSPSENLQPQSPYCITIAGDVSGLGTGPLGATIEARFTTGD